MADQPKKKPLSSKNRNDNRRNGKANKQHPGRRHRGEPLTYLQKTLMGGGAMVEARRMDRRSRLNYPDKGRAA